MLFNMIPFANLRIVQGTAVQASHFANAQLVNSPKTTAAAVHVFLITGCN